MSGQFRKKLEFFKNLSYITINILATPLSSWANAHFERVFSLIRECFGKYNEPPLTNRSDYQL
jgi:hypothetical protein